VNGSYSLVAFLSAFVLIGMAKRFGAKWVHAVCLALAGVGLLIFTRITNEYLLFLPIIGFGIAWASMMGVPYILIVSMVPKSRYGVYMGIVNMMIVVPMLIQNFTFTFIYTRFLGSDPTNAIVFSGTLLLVAALAMLMVRAPRADEESDYMPLASSRKLRELHLQKTLNRPLEPVLTALRSGPQEWLPDFKEEQGWPTSELRIEEAGQRVARRVKVTLGGLETGARGASVLLRWEALQHPQLYPRLDGTLRVDADNGHSQIRFDARYLPPAGRLGAAVDRVLMGRVARDSVGDFFDRLTTRLDTASRPSA
jgi:MFS family permease